MFDWLKVLISRARSGQTIDYEAWYRDCCDAGLQALAAGRFQEAVEALGQAVNLHPKSAEAHLNMGRAFEKVHKIEAARQAYIRALKAEPYGEAARAARADHDRLPLPPPSRKDFTAHQVLRSEVTDNTYTVLEVKGGGFGTVYIARDERDGEKYALKTFQARYLWSDRDRERFEREAATWLLLDPHPNVVSALWVERIAGFPCLVLEYVQGEDLERALQKRALPVERALTLAIQFCDAMVHAHGKLGIVHRDIKPSNCLLSAEGNLKVTDFGLALAFSKARQDALDLAELGGEVKSAYTTPLGTPQYMAPEQFRYGSHLDVRTDIHAFGVMLYQMLTCDVPEYGSTAWFYIRHNADAHRVPAAILKLILRCVQPDPNRRPRDFRVVRESLASAYRAITGLSPRRPAQLAPLGVEDWQNKAVGLQNIGLYQQAIFCYDRALEAAPWKADLWKGKGAALYGRRRYREAHECFERGLAIAANDSGLWNNLGLAKSALGDLQGAVNCYDRSLKISPRDSDTWGSKGKALHAMGKIEEALVCYEEGLIASPHNTGLLEKKGMAWIAIDRYDAARECFEEGLWIAPREYGLWKGLALALHHLGDYEQAIDCYEHGIEINPLDVDLYDNKAKAWLELGQAEEAIACFNEGLMIAPDDASLLKGKGAALFRVERAQEAKDCFEQALEIAPNDSVLHQNLGAALCELGQYAEALEWLDRGLVIDPLDPALWENKGLTLAAMERHEEAVACYNEGLKLAPGDTGLLENKGASLKAMGKSEAAATCFQQAALRASSADRARPTASACRDKEAAKETISKGEEPHAGESDSPRRTRKADG